MTLHWKMGFEVELLAPRGRSRLDLAERVAARHGGRVRRPEDSTSFYGAYLRDPTGNKIAVYCKP